MIVPEVVQPYLHMIYSPEELALIDWMGEQVLSRADIEQIAGKDCGPLLEQAYHKATVNIVEGEPLRYKVNPVKMRVGNMATFHREAWEAIPDEGRAALSHWHYREFVEMKRAMDFAGVSAKKNKVMPLEVAIRYMRETAQEIYVIPCDCKSTAEQCAPERRMVCLEFSSEPNSAVGRGYGKQLTPDEAEEILRFADAEGLYHTGEHKGICNCCRCCCYPGRATLELGYKGSWPKVLYVAQRDEAACIGCGRCTQRCPKEAMVLAENRVVFHAENCWGCGLCVNTCPANALSLQKLAATEDAPEPLPL